MKRYEITAGKKRRHIIKVGTFNKKKTAKLFVKQTKSYNPRLVKIGKHKGKRLSHHLT